MQFYSRASCCDYIREDTSIREFAKTSLASLVLEQIKRDHPHLMSDEMRKLDAVRNARMSADFKRKMLQLLWQEVGPTALLATGQEITSATYDPVWHMALRSSSPAFLFDKWHRFERFSHSSNRLKIDILTEKSVSFSRYRAEGGMPTVAENLLICGIMIALLEAIGCQGLTCEMPFLDVTGLKEGRLCDGPFLVRSEAEFSLPMDLSTLNTGAWTISWCAFKAKSLTERDTEDKLEIELPPITDEGVRDKLEGVVQHLLSDIARQWKIGELAEQAGYATRSLQRLLGRADLSFSRLTRLIRIQEASRLLKQASGSITVIGFCAGFSDSAHFSRDFRASMGMSPSDYRKLFQED